ncbi:hypothetical protein RFI_22598 [Reticulomyxa filosa]|uniref:Uncharacterized protein n=1 Tax=Reticulomyxa filosa TaxID=46433 RepID=X6MM95_RETFI|nr:hypothetical protein RFI_22598 [Reticulomyxa filosa]|eukprot:ETO14771.1 hypothetical protein RFI_22598 [Reticulomyxa filosa]
MENSITDHCNDNDKDSAGEINITDLLAQMREKRKHLRDALDTTLQQHELVSLQISDDATEQVSERSNRELIGYNITKSSKEKTDKLLSSFTPTYQIESNLALLTTITTDKELTFQTIQADYQNDSKSAEFETSNLESTLEPKGASIQDFGRVNESNIQQDGLLQQNKALPRVCCFNKFQENIFL